MSAITSGYTTNGFKDSRGGLKLIRLASFTDVEYFEDLDDHIVNLGLKTDKLFYTYELIRNVSGFTTSPTSDKKTGKRIFNESLNLVFNRINKSTSDRITELMKASVVAIAEDKVGNFVLLGRDGGLRMEGGTGTSGTASADRNGYEVRLSGIAKRISHVWDEFMTGAFYPNAYTRIFENNFATQFE